MRNFRIHTKLLASFLLVALLGAIPLFVNWSGTNQLQGNIRSMGGNLERVQSAMAINDLLKSIMASRMRLLVPDLPLLDRQQIYTDVESKLVTLRLEIGHYESMAESKYEQELLQQLHAQLIDWENYSRQYIELSRELDATDILNPLQFQNILLQYKESAYEWVASLSDSITNEALFKGALTAEESIFGQWLFGLNSNNASLAVSIGRARKPLARLFSSARKINTLIRSDREEIVEYLNAVFESETMPAKDELFKALGSMSAEADRAATIYAEMAEIVKKMSRSFVGINTSLEGLAQFNRDQASTIVMTSHEQVRMSNTVSWMAVSAGGIALVLLSLFLARKITRPIVDFNEVIKRFNASNDFSIQATVRSNDEVGQVARSFNEMVKQLKFYYDALQAKNKDLHLTHEQLEDAHLELERHSRTQEQKVAERTAEISSQKEKMQELNTKLVHMNDRLAREIDEHQATHVALKRARDVAEAADKTKSSFLANMSHEIRTPLNAVIGLTSLALKLEASVKVHDYLRTVKRSANSLLKIIEDILDFSKIEAGKLEIENINFSLQDVFSEMYELLRQKAKAKGLDFRYHIGAEVPDLLTGDPLRLGQVLMNLTNNALKFTDEGEVLISVICEECAAERGVVLKFSVADTGVGIAREKIGGLFEPFSQVDESISRTHGGTGLGLSICKKIVEQFSGKMWVESEVGCGSVFHFTASLGKQPDQELAGEELASSFAGYRVLVVDDNKMFRHFMAKMFTSFCFEVETAKSGREGLRVLHDMQSLGALPHIILLDQSMPDMDGFGLMQVLNDNPAFADIPVVMISASGQNEVMRHRAEQLGARAVLTKPVKRKLLFATIETLLGKTGSGLEKQLSHAEHQSRILAGYTILLVEDNPINQQVAYEILVSGGAKVDIATDGAQAVEVMDGKYDLVLMDIQMPVMDGIAATAIIRENARFKDVAIVAITAQAMKGDRERCLAAGMNDYVAKPIEPEELYLVLVEAIARQRLGEGDSTDRGDLGKFPGINLKKVMARLNNNNKLFHSLLGEFIADNADVITRLRDLFTAGDMEQAVYLAHTLKGVAGNLGADGVQDAALVVEQALRQAILPEAALADLELSLKEIFKSRRSLPRGKSGPEDKKTPLPDHAVLTSVFVELAERIQENTPKAAMYLADLPLYDNVTYLKYRKQILSHLDQFDFESARIVVVKMAAELGVSV